MNISIITVCYNAADGLKKTIKSVREQNYHEIEYIIIDGGSTDNTIDIIKGNNDVITQWISEHDKGIYDAMNKGIVKASGDYLIFMNAGDTFVSPNSLSLLLEGEEGFHGLIHGNIIRLYKKTKVKSSGITSNNPGIIDMISNCFHHQATLIRKDLFETIGLYSTKYRLCSDWKFFFDCIILNKVSSIYKNIDVAYFTMDGASSSSTMKYIEEQNDYLRTIYGSDLYELLQELVAYRKIKIAKWLYRSKHYIRQKLSDNMYVRLLNSKRKIRGFFGLKVN